MECRVSIKKTELAALRVLYILVAFFTLPPLIDNVSLSISLSLSVPACLLRQSERDIVCTRTICNSNLMPFNDSPVSCKLSL